MAQDNVLDLAVRRAAVEATPCAACPVRDLSICASLDSEQLVQLTTISREVNLAPGQALFYESDPAESLYVIKSGCARVYKLLVDGRRIIAGFLVVSDMIGLAEDEVYSYSCEAVTKLSLCRFPRRRLQSFFERYPALERRMLEIATNELAASQDQMVLLGRKTAQEKLASFLYLLACRSERRGDSSGAMVLPMTRSDIGDHLGLTTESVSRQFTQFRKQGIIQLEAAHMVRILDHAGLIAMTGSGDGDFEPHSAVI